MGSAWIQNDTTCMASHDDLNDFGDDQASKQAQQPLVSDWFDADAMRFVDVPPGIAGERVTADGNPIADSPPYPLSDSASVYGTAPGYIFCGDDGDSLWFWPEAEELAFRFDIDAAMSLRQALPVEVVRLLTQGALIYCNVTRASSHEGLQVSFPGSSSAAA